MTPADLESGDGAEGTGAMLAVGAILAFLGVFLAAGLLGVVAPPSCMGGSGGSASLATEVAVAVSSTCSLW